MTLPTLAGISAVLAFFALIEVNTLVFKAARQCLVWHIRETRR